MKVDVWRDVSEWGSMYMGRKETIWALYEEWRETKLNNVGFVSCFSPFVSYILLRLLPPINFFLLPVPAGATSCSFFVPSFLFTFPSLPHSLPMQPLPLEDAFICACVCFKNALYRPNVPFFFPPFCLLYFALLSLVREGRCRYHFHTQRQDGEGKGKRNKIASAGNERSRCSCRWCLMLLYYFSAPPSCAVPLVHEI